MGNLQWCSKPRPLDLELSIRSLAHYHCAMETAYHKLLDVYAHQEPFTKIGLAVLKNPVSISSSCERSKF